MRNEMIDMLEALKSVFAIISAFCFWKSSKNDVPETPLKGSVIKTEPFGILFASLKMASKQNSRGCAFLALSLGCEVISFLWNKFF